MPVRLARCPSFRDWRLVRMCPPHVLRRSLLHPHPPATGTGPLSTEPSPKCRRPSRPSRAEAAKALGITERATRKLRWSGCVGPSPALLGPACLISNINAHVFKLFDFTRGVGLCLWSPGITWDSPEKKKSPRKRKRESWRPGCVSHKRVAMSCYAINDAVDRKLHSMFTCHRQCAIVQCLPV